MCTEICSHYVQNYYSLKEIVPLEQMGEAGPPPPSQILDTPLVHSWWKTPNKHQSGNLTQLGIQPALARWGAMLHLDHNGYQYDEHIFKVTQMKGPGEESAN